MLTKENIDKTVKVISQDAWKVEVNTTVNAICEYIVRETVSLVLDEINSLKSELAAVKDILEALEEVDNHFEKFDNWNARLLQLEVKYLEKTLEKEYANASEDGGLQKSQRQPKGSNAPTRNAKAREVDDSLNAPNGA